MNMLRNIVLLKMLTLFPDAVECHYCEEGGGSGVLLLLPTQAFSFDRHTYPAAHHVVLLSTNSQALVRRLLAFVPQGVPLVFKLLDDADRRTIAEQFALRRVTAFVSYTAPAGQRFVPSRIVRVSETIDERCFALYAAQGHSHEDLNGYFAGGNAFTCTIYQGDAAVAACFAYPNFGSVYEIAGVYTLPSARRNGFARQLVETALHALAQRQAIPRYQVHEDNHASIALAEAIGLQRFVTMEHWLTL